MKYQKERSLTERIKEISPIEIFIGLLVSVLFIYGVYRINTSSRQLIPISVMAIVTGVVFEGRRLSDKWSTFLLKVLLSFVCSFIAFLPGKSEKHYDFEHHIEMFPYWFIFLFALASIIVHGDKVVPKLTEGITLLQSIAVIYWVIDFGLVNTNSMPLAVLMVAGLLFSIYSLFHAFTHTILTRSSRLTLSIWSSVIMMIFAFDNIFRVFQNEQIEKTADITHGFYIGLQFFLLGISSIYFIQNFFMVIRFMPGKGTFFNAAYFRDLNELKKEHVKRYSDRQVHIHHSFFCILFVGVVFALNYHFQIVPRHIAIWLVFFTFPLFLKFFNVMSGGRYH